MTFLPGLGDNPEANVLLAVAEADCDGATFLKEI
jgi:hypothetical protein